MDASKPDVKESLTGSREERAVKCLEEALNMLKVVANGEVHYDYSRALAVFARAEIDFPELKEEIREPMAKMSSLLEQEVVCVKRTEFVYISLMRILGKIKDMHTRNEWFVNDLMKVYVRKTERNIMGERVRTLEIGAIEVAEEYRRRGVFKRFTSRFEDIAYSEGRVVYIENVMPVFLQRHLENYGFTRLEGDCFCFCKKR
jgi:GNAT superfamily N-acetyltransferase